MLLTILEGAETIDIASIFTTAGTVMTGFVEMSVNFVTSLWQNPIGKVAIVLPFVSGGVALCYKVFFKRKRV